MTRSTYRQVEEFSTICSYCGRLLTLSGTEKTDMRSAAEGNSSESSHGICLDCLLKNFPKEYQAIEEEMKQRAADACKGEIKRGIRDL